MSSRTQLDSTTKKPFVTKDAIGMLIADHVRVSGLFADYKKTNYSSKRKALVTVICTELSLHAQIEEEIFYPAVNAALKDKLLISEAMVEHGGIKELVAQLEGLEPDGADYDDKVMVLSEYVKHHVNEQQNEMFPKVKASSMDLVDLGIRMVARKAELRAARV